MTHHAITITARERAELLEVTPPPLGTQEIRGRTLFSLISPGTELAYNYTGDKFPTVPGYAAVFMAEEIGSDVKDVVPGATLFCAGPHRSFQQVEANSVLAVPRGLAPEKAVLARLMGVSMTTLMTTAARPGDLVAISGAGPVGYLAAQMFARSGYDVLVAEPSEERRRYLQEAGLSSVHARLPHEDAAVAGTVALVVECSGHEQAVADACRIVRKGGEVVLVGVPWKKRTDLLAHELLRLVFYKFVVMRSGWEWMLPSQSTDFRPHSTFSGFATALKWLSKNEVSPNGLSTLVSPVNAQSAYQNLMQNKALGLFSIFDWRSS